MKRVALLAISLLLAGCSEDRIARSRVAELEAKLYELTKQTAAIKADHAQKISELVGETRSLRLEAINSQSTALEATRQSSENFLSIFDTFAPVSASVDPSKKGFSVARNKFGSYLVLLEDVQPYLDGHKLKLRIGNLTAATLTGVTVKVSYGPRVVMPVNPVQSETKVPDETDPVARNARINRDAQKAKEFGDALHEASNLLINRKRLETPVGRDLPPATWVDVEVVITPSKTEDIGSLEISVEADGARLAMGT